MTGPRLLLAPLALLLLFQPACDTVEDAEFLDCGAKCDQVGPLTVSGTWMPKGGFVRAMVQDGFEVAVEPAQGVTLTQHGNRWILQVDEEGFYSVIATRDGAAAASIDVRVADEGPSLVVDSPSADGFHITSSGPFTGLSGDQARVVGTAVDPLGAPLAVTVNGAEVNVGADGSYETIIDAQHGINVIDIRATDAAGNEFKSPVSFLAADSYSIEPHQSALFLDEAALDRLAAELSKELPALMEIPAPEEEVFSSLGQEIFIDRFIFPGQDSNSGFMTLTLSPLPGHIRVVLSSTGETKIEGRIDGIFSVSPFTAKITDLRATLDVSFTTVGEEIRASVSNVTVSSIDTAVEVSSLIPNFIFEWLVGSLEAKSKDGIEDNLPKWLTRVLSSVEEDFDIPTFGEIKHELPGMVRLARIESSANHLGIVVDVAVSSSDAPVRTGPGAATRKAPTLVPDGGTGLNIQLGYNLINQYLYRLWAEESFVFDMNEQDLADALAAVPQLEALNPIIEIGAVLELPPIVDEGTDGVELSLGELHMQVFIATDLFQATIEANISGRARVTASVVNSSIVVAAELAEIHVDVGRKAFTGLNPEAVERLLAELAPQLFAHVAESIETLPLPAFNLDGIGIDDMRMGLLNGNGRSTKDSFSVFGAMELLPE